MMAGRLKLIKLLKHARKLCKVTAAPAVMFGTVAVGFKRNTWNADKKGKDTVFFISKEENKIPCKVVIPKGEDLEEFREPLNPDGTVNWACGCIERDVVGPCNSEFRVFRQLIHDTKGYKDDMPMEKQMELHTIIKSYFDCMNEHPIYYAATLKRTTEGDDSEDVDVKADNNNDTDSKGEVSP
ncbi:hypothetical protein MAR_004695 [Mya arenaria]|uniref:Uncharacterized protein n=1 Tax=Mya arenaria TaxID=6604 RepID=A0ABY7EYY1_MYAAR|nr:hypothetical protein MAR_004695 [Mya arenaria]